MQPEAKISIVGAVVIFILQIVVAPNIALFGIVPNLLLIYAIVVAMLLPTNSSLVLAFVCGLASDLLGFGPVGSLAFLLVVAAFALVVNLLDALFILGASAALSPLDAFLYRALPCTLYECVLGLLIYPLMSHLLVGRAPTMGSATPSLRFR
jgi:rod shape-determining protein MreD